MECPYGFRIVGPIWERRRLVMAGAALEGYCSCEPQAEVEREVYLSAFCFGDDFRQQLQSTDSTAGFTGVCWAPWVWFDIDREDNLDAALADARRLAAFILDRYRSLDDDGLLAFFSGSKGFHLGIPTALWAPQPSDTFHKVARSFAEAMAAEVGVAIDAGVYDRVRAFRAPNSRHQKTGLYKRRLSHAELMGLALDRVLQLAAAPEPFEPPAAPGTDSQAIADWQTAERHLAGQVAAVARSREDGPPIRLNRPTLDFIRNGAAIGDRHRLLYSAAANLAEFGCPPALAHALLTDAALDSGLPPKDVCRQIDYGLARGQSGAGAEPANFAEEPATPAACPAPPPPPDLPGQLAALWASSKRSGIAEAVRRWRNHA